MSGADTSVLWPDAGELVTAIQSMLQAEGPDPMHPAVRVMRDLAQAYRDHAEAIEHCASPPLLASYEQVCDDWTAVAVAEQKLIDQFNDIATQQFHYESSASPGHLAARVVYWIIHAGPQSIHHSHAAIDAYNRWRARHLADPGTARPIEVSCI